MKKGLAFLSFCLALPLAHAGMTVTPWMPIFKGVDRAAGTNSPDATIPRLQAVNCVRVDLTDPDVRLFPTPPATNYQAEFRETLSMSVSNFLKTYRLQVAADANFYRATPGGGDPASEGIPTEIYGLQICTGAVVSVSTSEAEQRYCSLLFTTNNQPILAFNNRPPGTNTAGIYTAITGYYPVLTNGGIVGADYLAANFPDNTIHGVQPRTAFGISEDNRYLFMMIVDGRQPGYSDGALDQEIAMWMIRFGAWNTINMDGGGSAAMYMGDCTSNPLPLGHSSYIALRNRERYIGSQLGVFARPLVPIYDVTMVPGSFDAVVTWTTPTETTSQIDYGLTPGLYGTTAFDPARVTNHSLTLTELSPSTNYYLRITSTNETEQAVLDGCTTLRTTNAPGAVFVTTFNFNQIWRYNTTNQDGINWKARTYNDSGWPAGQGVLWADSRATPPNPIPEKRTQMPIDPSTTYPFVTYYFRTTFVYTDRLAGVTLTLTNLLDDGAVFYLNGVEIQRAFMPDAPTPILNSTTATGYFCSSGDANCPYAITIAGDSVTNLVVGTNVFAVEAHNFRANSPDVTFGASLSYSLPPPPPPAPPFVTNILVLPGETSATITWTTRSNATSQVEYGLTPTLGLFTPPDATLTTNHSITLTALKQLTPYYFRVISTVGAASYDATGTFSTVPYYQGVVALTNTWRYSTANHDGVNWQAPDFNDDAWPGGPALLWVDLDPNPNPLVQPKYTSMPANTAAGRPYTTYYFRTWFNLSDLTPGFSLILSNFVDDGAIFYLNGSEIYRLRMPPPPAGISNATFATGQPVTNDAVFADVFRLGGEAVTNLLVGTNVLAVEVHNVSDASSDVTFGSSIGWVRALVTETRLQVANSTNSACLSWTGTGFTLQRSSSLGSAASWEDVPGPVTTSPYCVPNPAVTMFYRLR